MADDSAGWPPKLLKYRVPSSSTGPESVGAARRGLKREPERSRLLARWTAGGGRSERPPDRKMRPARGPNKPLGIGERGRTAFGPDFAVSDVLLAAAFSGSRAVSVLSRVDLCQGPATGCPRVSGAADRRQSVCPPACLPVWLASRPRLVSLSLSHSREFLFSQINDICLLATQESSQLAPANWQVR